MKKSLGSFINLNRTPLLLLGIVLGIAAFGSIAWNVGAQKGAKDSRWTPEEASLRAAMIAQRMAADEASSSVEIEPSADAPLATFPADAASLGPIPDSPVAGCGNYGGTPRDVTFTVTGMTAPLTDVRVNFQTGAPVHTWAGDLRVTLRAPGGAPEHTILSQTGSTTPTGCGSSDDLPNLYNFFDSSPAAPTWWENVAAVGTLVPGGDFRTSTAGGVVGGGANTLMTPVFSGLTPAQINGTWTLRILDGGGGDTGSVSAATLTLTAGAGTPTPTNTPTSTPTNTPTATPTPGGNPVTDGGFEANTGAPVVTNPNWQSTSTAFTTSLCTVAVCGTGGGAAAPRAGNGWLWLGGTAAAESGSGSQSVVLPVGSNPMLKYFLRIGTVTAPFDATFRVLVDGVQQIQITEPAVAEAAYTERTINLNAFANGAAHVIRFEYTNPAGSGTSNFVVDDVRIDTTGVGTPTPTNTPTATPTATPAGTATPTSTPTATPTATPTPPPGGSCSTANTTIFAYDFTAETLIRFTAANPAMPGSVVPITGLAVDEFLTGIDFRPANGILYGTVSNNAGTLTRTVAINSSGQLVNVGGNLPGTADIFFGVDFNPVPDRIRIIGDADTSRRLNPNDGTLAGTDTSVAYVAGDPGAGVNPSVVHVAYTNSQAGAAVTTLFGIDSGRDTLVRIGGVDGTPSPNGGLLTTIGPLGVGDVTSFGAFDIQPGTNLAYAALRVGGVSRLYSINLTTGAATLLGTIGGGANPIDGLAVAPCVTAAGVEVSGRVLTPDGRGLRNATVSMTDNTGAVRTATTSTFGYYRFDDVSAGESFVMSVASRRYRFSPRVVQVLDSLTDVDFSGQE